MKQDIAVIGCADYEYRRVFEATAQAVGLLGGMGAFIKPGMRVIVKANLLKGNAPEDAVTTHPAVIAAVCRLVKEAGGKAIIADSPGGAARMDTLEEIYRICQMDIAAAESGAELNKDIGGYSAFYPEGLMLKSMELCRYIQDADAIINVAKLKTHMMMGYTGAVKNLFGVIPGKTKADYHYRINQIDRFADMLVDLQLFVKPVLHIIDAVWGMEGEGPSAGKPRFVGCLLAGSNPFALDTAGITLMGIAPQSIPTVAQAAKRGLCSRLEDCTLHGDDLQTFVRRDYDVPAVSGQLAHSLIPKAFRKFFLRRLRSKPVIIKRACVGCGICVKNCPPKAMVLVAGKPRVDLNACIRCYCCHELCPKKAIRVKNSWMFKLI